MKQLPDRLERLVASLEALERSDRIQMLVDAGKQYRRVPADVASPPFPVEHRVPDCESEAYVWAKPNSNGTLSFYFAVDNPQGISAMALASVLAKTLSGVPLDQVAAVPGDIVYRIFGRELSMGKSLGLMGMVNMVASLARQHLPSASQPRHAR